MTKNYFLNKDLNVFFSFSIHFPLITQFRTRFSKFLKSFSSVSMFSGYSFYDNFKCSRKMGKCFSQKLRMTAPPPPHNLQIIREDYSLLDKITETDKLVWCIFNHFVSTCPLLLFFQVLFNINFCRRNCCRTLRKIYQKNIEGEDYEP